MTTQRTWRGPALYFDTETSRTFTVEASITPSGISLIHDGSERPLSWDGMKIVPAGRSFVRIELSSPAGAVLTIQSSDAVAALAANTKVRLGLWGEFSRNKGLTGLILGSIVVLSLFFYAGVPLLVNACVAVIPRTVDAQLGQSVLSSFDTSVSTSDSLRHVLLKCARIIGEFRHGEGANALTIHVVEDTTIVNALAFPGGIILVYRGLLQTLEDESELFALLGHEAGHIVARHGMKNLTRHALLGFALTLLFRQTSGVADFYISNSSVLLNLAYDRDQEREADEFGLQALHALSVDPHGMVGLFGKLKAAMKEESQIPMFLSTHPALDERIARLQKRIAQLPPVSPVRRLSAAEWRLLTSSH